jgi:hypothetical protein
LSQPSTDNPPIKDERWAIKTFRPLLKLLKVQNIPTPPELRVVYMADNRSWIIQGMGRCIVIIEQQDLPGNIGGMFVTSHDISLDCFKLHILINKNLCNKTALNERADQKIAAIHEFTHAVAALSAISRIRSKILIERLREIFRKKTHAIHYKEIKKIASELSNSLFDVLSNIASDLNQSFYTKPGGLREENKEHYFPDEHFRLGFEDFPVSYPVIFEEFLLSREMFEEYFTNDLIESLYNAFLNNDSQAIINLISAPTIRIMNEKALYPNFAIARILAIFMLIYAKHDNS